MKLKNVSDGPRGVYVGGDDEKKDIGTMLVIPAGETSEEVELSHSQLVTARKTEWFEISGAGSRAKAD